MRAHNSRPAPGVGPRVGRELGEGQTQPPQHPPPQQFPPNLRAEADIPSGEDQPPTTHCQQEASVAIEVPGQVRVCVAWGPSARLFPTVTGMDSLCETLWSYILPG